MCFVNDSKKMMKDVGPQPVRHRTYSTIYRKIYKKIDLRFFFQIIKCPGMNCQNTNINQNLPSIMIFFVTLSFLYKIDIFHYSFGSRKVTKYKTSEKVCLFI